MSDPGARRNAFFPVGLKILTGCFLVAVAFVALRAREQGVLEISVETLPALVGRCGMWGPVLFVLVYMLRPLVLVPASIAVVAAGMIWGPVKGFGIVMIAAMLSASAEFFIARFLARDAILRLMRGRMAGLDAMIHNRGFMVVLFLRLVPNAPFDIQNLGLGLTQVRFRDYFWATMFGIMPASFALIYFGGSLWRTFSDPQQAGKLAAAIILLSGLSGLRHVVRRRQRARNSSAPVKPG